MRTHIDERLRAEIARYRLAFTCEQCVHFDEDRTSCSQGYLTEEHRRRTLEVGRTLVFCKSFEAH